MEKEPAYAVNVHNWSARERRVVDNSSTPYLIPLDSLRPGYYRLVAVLDTNTRRRGNSAPGNLYSSKEAILYIDANGRGTGNLVLNRTFREREFRPTRFVREIRLHSDLLSRFHHDSIFVQAALILPDSFYEKPDRIYPVVFIIPGWGGTHHHGAIPGNQRTYGVGTGKEKIYVYLNAESQTPWGLHAFVDSRVNGPWGKALVKEMLPYLRRTYRVSPNPGHAFLTGQSSGGYGVVWLAMNYPEHFGGAWATSPDPLDFSSFTGVNLYQDTNYYMNKDGSERGIYKTANGYKSTMRKSYRWENFEGDGGQQQSFEAEFGLPDKDGRPVPIFDMTSGRINRRVVQSWRMYDLALRLEKMGKAIDKLPQGGITIYAGSEDNFRLNESAESFGRKASAVNARIKVKIIPGADHFKVRSEALTQEIQQQIDDLSGNISD
ncbi:alpha/beta hydrolase-fold protein [Pedobacter sp. JY14-1]|uniref:alpha/beta hydrolase-fold protein n=1 Tax=Pedobacter sp. JY14-1 TaxID=3034151 RepID=UPI0023E09EAD|nr:alpha/beta hydrolase-fold protein [Pedobacter sp. JY14-1]